jgi:putative nucleotidyltransferase with HDIG domain
MDKKFDNVGMFLDTISDLPVLPANIQKITDLMASDSTRIEDISAVIATDQGLSSKVLKIANSAFYGRLSQVVRISESVVVIGMANIKSMLYAIFMDQIYGGVNDNGNTLVDLWKHSISTALMSQKLIERVNAGEKDAAYTAGLLHDIGELIMFKYEPKLFRDTISEINNSEGINRTIIEEAAVGFSHADLGAAISRRWNLPNTIKNGIFFHHAVEDSDTDRRVIAAVHVADCLGVLTGVGGTDKMPSGKTIKDITAPEALDILKIDAKKIDPVIAEMQQVKCSAEALMDSMEGGKKHADS